MLNQNPKSPGALINQLTNARAAANGKPVKVATPAAPKDDLSHLPPIERLTAARKMMAKHNKLAATNPAPTYPSGELLWDENSKCLGWSSYE